MQSKINKTSRDYNPINRPENQNRHTPPDNGWAGYAPTSRPENSNYLKVKKSKKKKRKFKKH